MTEKDIKIVKLMQNNAELNAYEIIFIHKIKIICCIWFLSNSVLFFVFNHTW